MTAADGDIHEAIMTATLDAVCTHGYADLTMQDIADEFDKSKSLLHYHYDTKADLFVAFLDYLIDNFEDRLDELTETDSPLDARFKRYIDWFAVDPDEPERYSLHLALLEMRTQAPHTKRFQERFARSDELATTAFAELIEEGQASGEFATDIDPIDLGRLCFVTMDGARARQLTIGKPGYAKAVGATLFEAVIKPRLRNEE